MDCARKSRCVTDAVVNNCKIVVAQMRRRRNGDEDPCDVSCEDHGIGFVANRAGEVPKCLDRGGSLHMWPCERVNVNQMWHFDTASGLLMAVATDWLSDRVHDTTPSSAKVTGVFGRNLCLSTDPIARLQECNASNPDQKWRFSLVPDVFNAVG